MKIRIKDYQRFDKSSLTESSVIKHHDKKPIQVALIKKKIPAINPHVSTVLIFIFLAAAIFFLLLTDPAIFSQKKPQVQEPQETDQAAQDVGFLELLNDDRYVAFYLSVADEASDNLTQQTRSKLQAMGSSRIQELGYRGSYVAVIENKRVTAEDLNNNGTAFIKFGRVTLLSSGYNFGSKSEILFNGHNLSAARRGINVVAQSKDGVLEQFSFDFHELANPVSKRISTAPAPTNFYSMQIILDEAGYKTLQKKREEALKIGILLTTDNDFVEAKIKYKDTLLDAKVRLKGDWVDHLKGKKWSYRIELKKDNKLFGMSKFSIHHPATRNYLGEWVFHKALKRENIIGLRYRFVNAELRIRGNKYDSLFDLGTYAMEESFDKYLIEDNKRREGVIIKINEDLIWEGTAQARRAGLNANLSQYQLSDYSNMTILPFSQKEILSDSNLSQQFKIARTLYYQFLQKQLKASDIFDIEKLAKYNAISCLLGAVHGLVLHNQRLYYNPIIGKFEPIGFDGNACEPITDVSFYALTSKDVPYQQAFANALEQVSKKEYLDDLLSSLDGMDKNFELLNMEFEEVIFDKSVLYQNQRVIEKALHPSTGFHAFLSEITNSKLVLKLRSISPFPMEILNISYQDKRVLARTKEPYILKGKNEQTIEFGLPEYYQNLFVDKKSGKVLFSKSKDLENFKITYRTFGTSQTSTAQILPWSERADENYVKNLAILKKSTIDQFGFLTVDEGKKTITIKSGEWKISDDLIIPKGYSVIGNEGFSINLTNEASIISYSRLLLEGSAERPISFFSEDSSGGGVVVIEAGVNSKIIHANFVNLRNPRPAGLNITGAVNFYESPVELKYVLIKGNKCEDALNIVRSKFSIYESIFMNTSSDAFDGDFVEGTILNTHFENLGNDAIDVSGSKVSVRGITILRAGDKGLSAGEGSILKGTKVNISESEIGVASKDKSLVKLDSIGLIKCELGFTAFEKKNEFGSATIEASNASSDCNKLFLIETNSALTLNGVRVATSKNVVNRLYGNEFGKKSE